MDTLHARRGITLMELVISVSLLAILSAIVLVRTNPFGEVASARNTQRELHLQAVMNSIRQHIADSATNTFACATGAVPTSSTKMAVGGGNYDIAPCLVPAYLASLPFDSKVSGTRYVSVSDYDTGYFIVRNASTSQITLSAPSAELGKTISITR